MSAERFEGKVARILSERTLVLNVGVRESVREGMRFAVLAEVPIEIHDPDSGELIGKVDQEKLRVEVIDVQEQVAICIAYETRFVGSTPITQMIGESLFTPPREVLRTLGSDDLPPPLTAEQKKVKVGDRARHVADAPVAEARRAS